MTKAWLTVYFHGKEPSFTPPLKLTGTVFQKQVYEYILSIPYGKRVSYGQVAEAIAGKRGLRKMSAQAIGQALKANKISIIVPCHRIIKNDGSLGGYGGGTKRKIFLLELESQGKSLIQEKHLTSEILTNVAFYSGWPNAWAAFRLAKEVYADASEEENHGGFFGLGQPNDAYAKYFQGKSYLNVLSKPGDPLAISNVTFEPGCRNRRHIRQAKEGGGQILICVEGRGYYQEWGKEAQELHPGDVVEIPPEVKHWHGASKDSWFAHLAFAVPGKDCSNEWLEPVSDEEYNKLK